MKKIFLSIFTALALTGANAQDYLDDIMFQTFGWDEYKQTRVSNEGGLYEYYNTRAGNLKANGFDMLWFPPPSDGEGVGYFPRELFNFSKTSWGTEAQLRKMLATMNGYGIYPIADVVANHRSGTTGWTTFTNPAWGCDVIVSNDEATAAFNSGNPAVSCRPSGALDTGDGFDGSRDMDHTNPTVQNGYKEFLSRLKGLGFKGWRWDVAKGFGTQYFKDYIATSQPYYSVGEWWAGSDQVNDLKNWTSATSTPGVANSGAFDFVLYYNLSRIIQTFGSQTANNQYSNLNWGGSMAGLAGQFGYADKAVTFVDNHDTFVHDSSFQGSNILTAYAYILTHPGIPSVFAPHYYGGTYTKDGVTRTYPTNYGAQINLLSAIRKANGINAYSNVTIDKSEAGLYAAYIKKSSSDAEPVVAVRIGAYDTWTPSGTGWSLVAQNPSLTTGNTAGYKIWSKNPVNVAPTIAINPVGGTFATGTTQNVTLSVNDPYYNAAVVANFPLTTYYTTDGSDPTTSSTRQVYTTGMTIPVSTNSTIKAVTYDSKGLSSGITERSYNFQTATDIVIRFQPPAGEANWSAPKIHYWDILPTNNTMSPVTWETPVNMTADPNNPGWFYFTFPNVIQASFLFRTALPTATSEGVIGVNKTGDIVNVTQSSCYVWDTTTSSFVRSTDCSTLLSTGEANANSNKTTLQVTQNPAINGELKVKYTNAKGGNISIFDMSGKTVGNYKVGANSSEETFSINGLKPGVYVLQLKSESGTAVTKLIVK